MLGVIGVVPVDLIATLEWAFHVEVALEDLGSLLGWPLEIFKLDGFYVQGVSDAFFYNLGLNVF